ncbi:MAG: hypothetical protein ACI828_002451 [Flavobacteriales bacterium]|jgi:hypothetical protein
MFSTGQLIFVIFFVIAFIILMILAYRKDASLHKKQYKGSKWVLIGFLAFIGLLFVIKIVLNR